MSNADTDSEDQSIDYRISICCDGPVRGSDDGGFPFVMPFRIHVTGNSWDEKFQEVVSVDVGKGEGFRINAALALDHRVSIFQECDDHSSEAIDYLTVVQNPRTREWRSSILKQFGHDVCDIDLLAITKMEIKEEHRGKNLGLHAVLRAMQTLGGGCGLAMLKPWPLQYSAKEFEAITKEGKTEQGWTEADRLRAFKKMKKHWEKLGFEQIGKTPYAAFPFYSPLPKLEPLVSA